MKSQRGWKASGNPEDWVCNQPHALRSGVQVQSEKFLLWFLMGEFGPWKFSPDHWKLTQPL